MLTTQPPPVTCPFGGPDDDGQCLDRGGRDRHVQTVRIPIDSYQPWSPAMTQPIDFRTPPPPLAATARAWQAWWEDRDMWDGFVPYADLDTAKVQAAVDYVGEEHGWVPGDDPADEAPEITLTWAFEHQRWHLLEDAKPTGVQLYETTTYERVPADEGDELVCVDQCGSCDACGMEPFGTPAEGWREAARFLRRTARQSSDRAASLRGARLIEDELRRRAEDVEEFNYRRDPDAELVLNTLPLEAQRSIRTQLAADARQDGAQS